MNEWLVKWSDESIGLMRDIHESRLTNSEIKAIRAGGMFHAGATDLEIRMLKEKIHSDLPAELENILKFSNGFLMPNFSTESTNFLSTEQIGAYRLLEPDDFDGWVSIVRRVGSDQYDPFDSADEVAEVEMPRIIDLERAFSLSGLCGGVIIIMYKHDVGGGSVWEFLRLSSHTTSRRYASLVKLLMDVREYSLASLREPLN